MNRRNIRVAVLAVAVLLIVTYFEFVVGNLLAHSSAKPQGVGMPPTSVARWCVTTETPQPVRAHHGLCPTGAMAFGSDREALLWMATLKILPREREHGRSVVSD